MKPSQSQDILVLKNALKTFLAIYIQKIKIIKSICESPNTGQGLNTVSCSEI